METVSSLIKDFGWPGAILIAGLLGAWKIVKMLIRWGKPWLEKMATSWIERNKQAADAHTRLVDKTIEIQEAGIEIQKANKEAIEQLPKLIERLLRAKPPP